LKGHDKFHSMICRPWRQLKVQQHWRHSGVNIVMFIIINLASPYLPPPPLNFFNWSTWNLSISLWACVDLNPKQPELEKNTLNIPYQKITNLNPKTTLIYFTYFSE
jgi:hypothetical protein